MERGMRLPLDVVNSEPAKLAIARIAGLAERFLLVDDDFFIGPWSSVPLTTRSFFDASGLPLQPRPLRDSHRPIPFLRDAYRQAVDAEPTLNLVRVMRSSTDARHGSYSTVDLLPAWCRSMQQKGEARPVNSAVRCPGVRRQPCAMNASTMSLQNGSILTASYWLKRDLSVSRFITSQHSKTFFRAVWRDHPDLICVNDDWPVKPDEYRSSIAPFHDFLARAYPLRASWETDAGASWRVIGTPTSQGRQLVDDGSGSRSAALSRNGVAKASSDLQPFACGGTGHELQLPRRAFDHPPRLRRLLLSHLTPQRRDELRLNPNNLSADALTASVAHLDFVDVDNTISIAAAAGGPGRRLRVAELNAERGRYWCELAAQVLATPVLNQVDVWLLNEFDLGMARSEQQHTARLLAYALGLNYVWAAEFVELSNGNKQEQARTAGRENRWGLHGNAILSRWPLYDAEVVRMPGQAPLYSSRGRETAFGYEKRLGGRMTLFAKADVVGMSGISVPAPPSARLLLAAMHAQTSWKHAAHTSAAINAIKTYIASGTTPTSKLAAGGSPGRPRRTILGGDTWPGTCRWLGLSGLVTRKSPSNRVSVDGKVRLHPDGKDDYICADESVKLLEKPSHLAAAGRPVDTRPEFVLSDHVFVVATVEV